MESSRERADNTVARALRRRWPIIVVSCIIAGVAAFAVSASREKQYTATASLLFRDPGFDKTLFGTLSLGDTQDPDREAATNTDLVSLPTVAQRAALSVGGVSGSQVSADTTVRDEGSSDVVKIAVVNADPQLAASIANAVGTQYIEFRKDSDRAKVEQAANLVQAQLNTATTTGTARRSLQQRLEQLKVLESLQTGNAELVQPASVPTAASSPHPTRDALLGAVAGLLFGLALALLVERLDRRIRDSGELERMWSFPILAEVPQSSNVDRVAHPGSGALPLPPAETEAFSMLRARLRYFNVDRDIHVILVTSALPAEGKSTIAWRLANTAALAGGRVLLLEADLRKPVLASMINARQTPGLAEYLVHLADIDAAIQRIDLKDHDGNVRASIDVMVAGIHPPNPGELLESQTMERLISYGREHYDFVVIDTPPAQVVSDAVPLIARVDGVVAVSRLNVTTRDAVERFRDQLIKLNAPVLGVVANGVSSRDLGYAYSYDYSSAPPTNTPTASSV